MPQGDFQGIRMPSVTANTVTPRPLPAAIGRFIPLRVLGQGGQGVVYLARDPKLDREVAIKTLARGSSRSTERLVNEARNVAKLDHPCIVPLYEIEFIGETPHLVYQFAAGTPLKAFIDRHEAMEPKRAIRIMSQVLDAIGYAHARGILHRDLSPANILVDDNDRPRILDFGISMVMDETERHGEVVGTVNYLAPELLSNGQLGPHSDIFAASVIFHELLTGKTLFSAENKMAIIYKILNEPMLPPSTVNRSVDAALDPIVMKGLARDPANRFREAAMMHAELEAYLAPKEAAEQSSSTTQPGAVELLLRKMQRKPDFPAISRFISEINQKAASSQSAHTSDLANVILKDYALTTKLLRLVNSAIYGQYGGSITTITRAVMILGFDNVRAAALSIAIFEHLKSGKQGDTLKDAACSSFLSALLARDVARGESGVDPEEAFIGAMFHRLGRHLAIYYFPEEYDEIRALAETRGISEFAAAKEILGATYAEFGLAVAKAWNFPDVLRSAMTPQRDGKLPAAANAATRTAQIAAFANEASETVGHADNPEDLQVRLAHLAERYGNCLKTDAKALKGAVCTALEATQSYATVLTVDLQSSSFFKRATKQLHPKEEKLPTQVAGATATGTTGAIPPPGGAAAPGAVATAGETGTPEAQEPMTEENRKMFLINAIGDLTGLLLDDYKMNDVFVLVLEALYRGLGLTRTLLYIRDTKNRQMQARFGLGNDVDTLLPKYCFDANGDGTVFHDCIAQRKEFVVLDVNSEQYRTRVPAWLRELSAPQSLMVFPLVAQKVCIGLIYGEKSGSPAALGAQEFKLVNTLIKQTQLAIQQRHA